MKILAILLSVGFGFAGSYQDCIRNAVEIERAIEVARDYVGKPFKVWIGQSKKTGECYWKVKGTEGYIILKAETGEIVKFYRNR